MRITDHAKIVNREERHLKLRFKNLRLLQPSPRPRRSVGSPSCSGALTGVTNALQLLSPLVRKHALVLRVRRKAASLQALLPNGSTAPPRHAGIPHLTSRIPQLGQPIA